MNQLRPPVCPYCRQPMNLFRTISKGPSPLFVFHCSRCNHTTTKEQKLPQAIRQPPLEGRQRPL
jgi:tRNA(Ile2) C34 agmatinyltransferase TiaS